jgi:hypothetical protein
MPLPYAPYWHRMTSAATKTPDPQRIALGVRGGTIQQALAKIAQLERQ